MGEKEKRLRLPKQGISEAFSSVGGTGFEILFWPASHFLQMPPIGLFSRLFVSCCTHQVQQKAQNVLPSRKYFSKAWNREAECEDDGGAAFGAFLDAFWEALPPENPDHTDLTRWPEGIPQAPPDDDGETKLWKIGRRDKGKGEDERLAAGFVLMQLAMARVARIYHRPLG